MKEGELKLVGSEEKIVNYCEPQQQLVCVEEDDVAVDEIQESHIYETNEKSLNAGMEIEDEHGEVIK